MVASPEVRTIRRRAIRAPYPPNISLPVVLEAPQVLSPNEIREVQVAPEVELESIDIMSGVGETEGISEKESFKKAFYDLT